jgi:hypothetical protein
MVKPTKKRSLKNSMMSRNKSKFYQISLYTSILFKSRKLDFTPLMLKKKINFLSPNLFFFIIYFFNIPLFFTFYPNYYVINK